MLNRDSLPNLLIWEAIGHFKIRMPCSLYEDDLISSAILPLKTKVNPAENANYHVDAADLVKMNQLDSTIFPYLPDLGMTKNDYIDYMRSRWIKRIQEERFYPLIEHALDRSFKLYEVEWVG